VKNANVRLTKITEKETRTMFSSDSDNNLDIEIHNDDHTAVLKPIGDIDMSRSPQLRTAIAQVQKPQPSKRIIVDLTAVPYMDSSGVATLVEAVQIARRHGGQIVLCNLNDRVLSIIEIARLDTVFTILPTLDDALNA